MGWFRRRSGSPTGRQANTADIAHLEQFIQSRRGVEAFIEPRTTVTDTTVILIAFDGVWSIPVYDVQLVGYPQRMRDFNERRKHSA